MKIQNGKSMDNNGNGNEKFYQEGKSIDMTGTPRNFRSQGSANSKDLQSKSNKDLN